MITFTFVECKITTRLSYRYFL